MTYQPRNVLVTGGAGFIGCNYIRYLLAHHPEVRIVNLDALTYAGSLDNLKDLPDPSRHTFIQGDICDRALVDRLVRASDIDTVVHFAAESHVDRSITGPGAFVQTNVVGTYTLLEACRQFWLGERKLSRGDAAVTRRFHHVSTDEVYGTLGPNDPPFTESTPYAPNSPYSASKASSDHLARAYFHTYGLPVTTSNCSNNYGPYQNGEKLIPTVIRCCAERRAIPVYGNGSNIRDWLYVEDHCRAIECIIRTGQLGETYNIGGSNEMRNVDIIKIICSFFDKHRPLEVPYEQLVEYVRDRPGHDQRYAVNSGKISSQLGWSITVTFRDRLEHYLNSHITLNTTQPTAIAV